jgi:hypothetical protein
MRHGCASTVLHHTSRTARHNPARPDGLHGHRSSARSQCIANETMQGKQSTRPPPRLPAETETHAGANARLRPEAHAALDTQPSLASAGGRRHSTVCRTARSVGRGVPCKGDSEGAHVPADVEHVVPFRNERAHPLHLELAPACTSAPLRHTIPRLAPNATGRCDSPSYSVSSWLLLAHAHYTATTSHAQTPARAHAHTRTYPRMCARTHTRAPALPHLGWCVRARGFGWCVRAGPPAHARLLLASRRRKEGAVGELSSRGRCRAPLSV